MNKCSALLFAVGLVASIPFPVQANESVLAKSAIEPASGEAPAFSTSDLAPKQWVVQFTDSKISPRPSADGKPVVGNLLKTEVVLNSRFRYEIREFTGGDRKEFWVVNGIILSRNGNSPIQVNNPAFAEFAAKDGKNALPELEWLSSDTFVGASVYEDKEVDVFQRHSESNGILLAEALIDRQTGFPLVVDDGVRLGTYTVDSKPLPESTLPPDVTKAYQAYLDGLRRAERHRMPQ